MSVAAQARSTSSRPRGIARREALLDAVIQIVADRGVDEVTHRRVAEVAQLPLASTTYWFASREEMLTAALELAARRDIARLERCAQELTEVDVTPDMILSLIFDPLADDLQHSRGSVLGAYALWLEAARRPALRELASGWSEAYVAATSRLLGRAGSPNPVGDARLVVAAIDGLAVHQLVDGGPISVRSELQRLITTLLSSR
jgi:TetR/AcrR family transcriptional regulator, regulator of biofilm formation and stress response